MIDADRDTAGPHQNQLLVTAGAQPDNAEAAVIAVHGRGATARSMIQFTEEFRRLCCLAP